MMQTYVIDPNELRAIIADTVNACLNDWQPLPPPLPEYDGLSPDAAIEHLTKEGYPIKLATLYKLVHLRQIPFIKRGKRLVFSRRELTAWLSKGKIKTNSERLEETENYIASQKKKGGVK